MTSPERSGLELRDHVAVLRQRKYTVMAVMVLVVGAAVLLSFLQTPVYESTSRVLLRPTTSVFEARGGSQVQDPVLVQTEIQVFRSEQVRELVRKRLDGAAPNVRVAAVAQTAVVEVTGESTIPQRAADIANAYIAGYIEFRQDEATTATLAATRDVQERVDALQKEIKTFDEQLAALPACTGTAPVANCDRRDKLNQDRDSLVTQLAPLRQRLNELQLGTSTTSGPQVLVPASASSKPVRPQPVRNGLLGIGMGLTFGIAVAFAFEHFDDSIKSKEEMERIGQGLPVLGMIPQVGNWRDRRQPRVVSQAEKSSQAAEAYRSLRTSIRFSGLDRSIKVIQVTSPNSADGKTTTVANLAIALAQAGERVVVVSADLRRPRIHEFFSLKNDFGFMSVILGEMPLSEAMQVVPGEPQVRLLGTGQLPANPSEVLSSGRTAQVLTALSNAASIVLIDCPPVLPVTDAAVLSAMVDATLVVGSQGVTTRHQMSLALEMLRQVGAPLIGTVLNGVPLHARYGGYGGYGGYYGQVQPAPRGSRRGSGRGEMPPLEHPQANGSASVRGLRIASTERKQRRTS